MVIVALYCLYCWICLLSGNGVQRAVYRRCLFGRHTIPVWIICLDRSSSSTSCFAGEPMDAFLGLYTALEKSKLSAEILPAVAGLNYGRNRNFVHVKWFATETETAPKFNQFRRRYDNRNRISVDLQYLLTLAIWKKWSRVYRWTSLTYTMSMSKSLTNQVWLATAEWILFSDNSPLYHQQYLQWYN